MKISELYDLSRTRAGEYLARFVYPWEALSGIRGMIMEIGRSLPDEEFDHPSENVWIAKDAVVYPSAYIGGPCIIDRGAEVRHSAFIRGSALIGRDCVVGNSTEIKNAILFDNTQAPHFNYVGDSILGYHSHMGAGSITSNVKSDSTFVVIKYPDGSSVDTGAKKVGAMLGDYVEVGCNAVLNPGTVVGQHTSIYPLSRVRGVIPARHIFKDEAHIVAKR